MRIALLCLGLSLLICNPVAASAPETPQFRQFGVADGLPSSGTTALARDRDGYLWIGTKDGLARYDGVGFRIYRHIPGDSTALPDNNVQALHVDAANRLWVGVEGQGLSVMSADRDGFRQINRANQPLLQSDDVWAITSTADGALWFGTYAGGLYRLDRHDRLVRFLPQTNNPHSLPAENVLALAVDARGTLWVGTTNGLARWTPQGFETIPVSALSAPMIVSLSADPDGSLWIGTQTGLDHRLPDGRIETPAWRAQLPNAEVTSVLRDREGTRWITTVQGLCRERGGVIDTLEDTPAHHRSMFMSLEDAEGGLWFATVNAGLLRLPAGWRHFSVLDAGDAANDVASAAVRGSALSHDGRVWLVGSGGALDLLDPQSGRVEHRLHAPKDLPDTRLWSVFERRDGSVWIGHQQGLSRYDPVSGAIAHWRIGQGEQPLLPGPVKWLTETPDGLLWLLSYGGGLQARDSVGRVVYSLLPRDGKGLESADSTQLSTGPDGALWIAGSNGLSRWNDDSERLEKIPGTPDDLVYGFAFVAPDTIWLHRMDALEAYRWNGRTLEKFRSIGTDEGLPAVKSGGLMVDRSGSLWLSTARGLVHYDPVGQRLRVFGVRDGLPSQELDTFAPLLTAQGLGIAASNAELVLFDPAQIRGSSQLPQLVLDAVDFRREEDTLPLSPRSSRVTLQPADRDLHVTARLLSFADPQAHRYRFWLHGYDPDWVEVGASGERVFSRLDAGSYRLQVIAANADGVWSAAQGFRLDVLPPWWRTLWARSGFVLIATLSLLLLALAYRARLRSRHAAILREQQRLLVEQGSEAKTRFLATLGHEIRTPMTGVLGMAELLQGGALDDKQRGQVGAIQRAGQHLLRLVNDALDLARIEAGKLTLQDEAFDLNALLDEAAALLRPLADAKGLAFSLQRSPNTPRVLRGDAQRVRQILLNLGNNAIKFTERGEVAIRTSALAPHGVTLEVSDTGPGLNAEQQTRLFQRFEQADGARTTQRYGGSGLGLAICQELAAAMHGRVDVVSAPGQGASFRVALPLANATPAEIESPIAHPAVASRRALRILLVEDEPMVAEVIVGLLQSLGHSVAHASQGLAALAELSAARFDLAFLDLDLPGIDGFELARLIKTQGHTLPLVALTARADPEAEPQARAVGMAGFLRKPVTGSMLAQTIESMLA
jgi:signal transduction histidine kinase/ligand-binding sensor domain-containing protein/CheY-like chemotaxis protein